MLNGSRLMGSSPEPLRDYAEILARHPSHAARFRPSVYGLLGPRLLVREGDGQEDRLYLTSRLTFLRLLRNPDGEFEVDAGTWSQEGRQVSLRGLQDRVVDLAEESLPTGGYRAEPIAPLPAHVKAYLRMPPRDLSDDETAQWLGGMAAMWIERLRSKN